MGILLFVLVLSGVGLVGCAHTAMRGSVAMKGDNQEAHVCLGDNEVKVGDRVSLYKNQCNGRGGKAGDIVCQKIPLGGGEVTRLLNRHYSVVKVDPGVLFEEGTVVEKN